MLSLQAPESLPHPLAVALARARDSATAMPLPQLLNQISDNLTGFKVEIDEKRGKIVLKMAKMDENGAKMDENGAKMAENEAKMAEMSENGSKMSEKGSKMSENGSEMPENGSKMPENPSKWPDLSDFSRVELDLEPFAAASIGQVHRGVLGGCVWAREWQWLGGSDTSVSIRPRRSFWYQIECGSGCFDQDMA
jgi:predicted unusual protein kinase regulating ubiquinone biosynthesis (AarF/ABC1/UbiB family)